MSRYGSTADIIPYSDRKALHDEPLPWTDQDLVEAQRMHCNGTPVDEIAKTLDREREQVVKLLSPEDFPTKKRPERAVVGFAHMKKER